MKCLIATRSPGKAREFRALLHDLGTITITTPDEVGLEYDPEEDSIEIYHTFQENARAKALYFARLTGIPAIADDSGIAVAALDGAPGVRSKRFYLDHLKRTTEGDGENPNHQGKSSPTGIDLDRANNEHLLERLSQLKTTDRRAHYACAIALALPDGRVPLTTIGTVSGEITKEPRGDEGFGYDPIFIIPELNRTFAEMDPAQKNERSHRARAANALRSQLTHVLTTG